MFLKHKVDPLVEVEIARLRGELQASERRMEALLKVIEDKIDAFLAEKNPVQEEKAKPEPLAAMPGYVSPSRRKAQRQAEHASGSFAERVVKGAASTIPAAEPIE